MSRTQIGGSRIKKKSINLDHLDDKIKIPELYLDLVYPSHPHINKDTLDRLRYTGAKDIIDLRNLDVLYLEVMGARKEGYSLAGTLDLKVNVDDYNEIKQEVLDAKSGHDTLFEAIRAYGSQIEDELNAHKGAIQHAELDEMYHDYISSKNGMSSLADRLNTLGTGGTGTGGTTTINTLNPWRYTYTVTNSSTDDEANKTITLPYAYVPLSNSIEVFEGPMLMSSGSDKDYMEVDEHTIKFNYKLPTGSIVNIKGLDGCSLYLWKQVFYTTLNQKVFSFLSDYVVGNDDLEVYESGLLMTRNVDYNETSDKSITFIDPLPANVIVTVQRRR